MDDVRANKATIEQTAKLFNDGGNKFKDNLKIPLDKAKKLHEEANTPATEQILQQCEQIYKNGDSVVEVMKTIAKTLRLAIEDMIKIGILK